ncbi:hypothetical protein COO60DRAFT_1625992 [Scenedesmus sp. NREL 46B-D3]|nr:hypothetical protein COO60DRAFT_1625992 [Scenedesmus sp. NREL 46B-D3]
MTEEVTASQCAARLPSSVPSSSAELKLSTTGLPCMDCLQVQCVDDIQQLLQSVAQHQHQADGLLLTLDAAGVPGPAAVNGTGQPPDAAGLRNQLADKLGQQVAWLSSQLAAARKEARALQQQLAGLQAEHGQLAEHAASREGALAAQMRRVGARGAQAAAAAADDRAVLLGQVSVSQQLLASQLAEVKAQSSALLQQKDARIAALAAQLADTQRQLQQAQRAAEAAAAAAGSAKVHQGLPVPHGPAEHCSSTRAAAAARHMASSSVRQQAGECSVWQQRQPTRVKQELAAERRRAASLLCTARSVQRSQAAATNSFLAENQQEQQRQAGFSTSCPFWHPGERARRRDPRLYSYEPLLCPNDKKGIHCRRMLCFFAHNMNELRRVEEGALPAAADEDKPADEATAPPPAATLPAPAAAAATQPAAAPPPPPPPPPPPHVGQAWLVPGARLCCGTGAQLYDVAGSAGCA